jgi:hypothetical protein
MWGCSTLIAVGPVPHRATVLIRDVVDFAKEDDLKQIVELPALSLSVSAGLIATTMGKYTKKSCG